MKKLLLILTIIITSSTYLFSQCNQAANITLDGNWASFGDGWYRYVPPVNGTINLCPLGLIVQVYDDCFGTDGANQLSLIPTGEFCGSDLCDDQSTRLLNVNAGDDIYFHFFFGFVDCGDIVNLRFLEEGNDCITPTFITCGETINFNTTYLSNKINFQDLSSCGAPTINTTGQEKVFLLSVPFPQDVTISMNSFKGDRDILGVYQNCSDCIAGCFLEGCIGYSQLSNGMDEVFIPGAVGNFYIVADWLPNNQSDLEEGNNFVVSVSCGNPCGDPEILSCGMTINSTTINEVNSFGFNDYGSCNIGPFLYDGPDKVFQINKPSDQGNLMINLNIPNLSDLEVLLFEECGGSCLAVGQNTPGGKYIFDADPPLPAGDYFVVVDGEFDEIGFDFGLTVTCGDLDCNNATELSCSVPLIGESNAGGNNNTSIYDCDNSGITSGYTGNEMVYTFTLPNTADVTINLENIANNQDLDLIMLNNCDELTCVQSSQNGLGMAEQIVADQLPAGTYYVVVEGVYGSTGTYDITVDWNCCEDVVINDCPFLFYNYEGSGPNGAINYCFNIDYGMIDPEPVISNSVTIDGDIVIPDTMSILQDFCLTFQSAGTYEVCYNTITEVGCTTQCCITVEVVDPSDNFQCVFGDSDNNTTRQVKWRDGAIYLASDNNAATDANNEIPVFSKFDLSGNFVWGIELGINGRIRDFEQTDNGDFLIVGLTPIVNNNDNESFIAKVDASGNLLWTNTLFNEGREQITAIIKHSNPADPNYPFYLSGFQNPSNISPSATDNVMLFNINENGGINWKKEIDAENDNQFGQKIVPLANGNFIIIGDSNIGGYFAEVSTSGNVVAAYTSGTTISRIWAALALPNGDLIFSGRNGNNEAVIAKVDANLNQIWSLQFPDQGEMIRLDMDGQNNIYVMGSTSAGLNPVVTKINDSGASATVEWIKTLDDQNLANASNAYFDVLNTGNIVYTDTRNIPNTGLGQQDVFLALTDNALSSCFTVDLPINSSAYTVTFESTSAASVDDTVQDVAQNMDFTPWDPGQLCPCDNCEASFSFTISPNDCQTVTFTNQSSGYNLTYFWDFGNSNTSPLENPVEVFTPGSYNVCLTVSNGVCMDIYCEVIEVGDDEPPVVDCLMDITLTADPGECTVDYTMPQPTAFDNCADPASLTFIPTRDDGMNLTDPWMVGITCVDWIIADENGNVAFCQSCVTVEYTLVCPGNQTLIADDNCQAILPNLTDAIVLCPNSSSETFVSQNPIPGTVLTSGCYNVTITLNEDGVATESCVVEVCVEDQSPPMINCPMGITLTTDMGECMVDYTMPQPTATDNCTNPASLTFTPTRDDGMNLTDPWMVGITCVDWIIADENGNVAFCQSCVTVEFTLVCPADQTLIADDNCQAILPNLTDAIVLCPNSSSETFVSQNPIPGTVLTSGCYNVTITLNEDDVAIESCVVEICVEDQTPPTINCPDDICHFLDQVATGANINYPPPVVFDNCGASLTCTPPTGSFFPVGTTVVNCIATDSSGLSAPCSFLVEVKDTSCSPVCLIPEYKGGTVDSNCCWTLLYTNPDILDLRYLSLSLQNNNGVLIYDEITPPPGTQFFTNSSTQVAFGPASGATSLPSGTIPDFFDFCITGMQNTPQVIAVDWYNASLELVHSDTLFFDCEPEPFGCLYVIEQTDPECDSTGAYNVNLTMKNPLGNDGFTVELIKFSPPAGATYTVSPASYYPAGGVPPGGITSTGITISGALAGDTVCFLVSAHDSLEIICCAEQEICVVLPGCPLCEQVDAALCPISIGSGGACCSDDPLSLPWVQDIIADCDQSPCGWEVSCCTYEGEPVIVIGPSIACSDFPTTFYSCDGTVLAQSGGITGGDGLAVTECEIIYECADGQESLPGGCCYELKLENNYAPDFFTAVEVKILTPGVEFASISFDFGNNWTYSEVVFQRHLRWTYLGVGAPNVPLGDIGLMDFCFDDLDGLVVLSICWMVDDVIVCQERLDVNCDDTPTNCAEVLSDEVICNPDGSYTYSFNILNESGLDVHEISFIDTVSAYGNLGSIFFTTPVADGAVASGSITFNLPGVPPDSLCLLIVMRHQLENGVSIICCNIEHCIDLPDCDVLCPDCADFAEYQDDVFAGFSTNIECPNGVFIPNSLSLCDIVEWTIIWPPDFFDPDQVTTNGSEPLVYTFPFAGDYTICMEVLRFNNTGELCFDVLDPICIDIVVDCPDIQCIDPNQPTGNPCPAIFDPVCGCDGTEYGNACEAFEAGVVQWIDGSCGPNPVVPVPDLIVSPIPATNMIYVQLSKAGKYDLAISSPERGLMSTQTIQTDGSAVQLSIEHLPLGVYWITATDRRTGQAVTSRFVKANWR